MELTERISSLREVIRMALDEAQGPYGVSWWVDDHAIAQTGYAFTTEAEALEIAERGPWQAERAGYQVDGMCEHYPEDEGIVIWGSVENEDAVLAEIQTTGGP